MGYNINDWVSENVGKNPREMLVVVDAIHTSLKRVENGRKKKGDDFYEFLRYIQAFYFFIGNPDYPIESKLDPFKPIIDDWFEKGYLNKSL